MQFPERSVLVCANQRSGSTMLCWALRDTGLAGRPEEYFLSVDEDQFPELGGWERGNHANPGMTRADYVNHVYQAGTTPNGVFATKLMWIQLEWMWPKFRGVPELADLDDDDLFSTVFPRAQPILLTRRDRVAQAVSWARADQDGAWIDSDELIHAATGTPRYDGELIRNLIRTIETGEAEWRKLFDRLGLEPIDVVYEDLVDDLGGQVSEIVDRLGLGTVDPASIAPATRRQADELNAAWIKRYRCEQ